MFNTISWLVLGLVCGYLLGSMIAENHVKYRTVVDMVDAFATFIRIHSETPKETIGKFAEFMNVVFNDPSIVKEMQKDLEEEGK